MTKKKDKTRRPPLSAIEDLELTEDLGLLTWDELLADMELPTWAELFADMEKLDAELLELPAVELLDCPGDELELDDFEIPKIEWPKIEKPRRKKETRQS